MTSQAELSLLDPRSESYLLTVEGAPQSQVSLNDPTLLSFDYVRRIGRLIDAVAPPAQAITVLHLGGGALTLPRYVNHIRPGSTQHVVELERDLSEMLLSKLPLPADHNINFHYGDARAILVQSSAVQLPKSDLLVIDLFSGAHIPPHVASREFYQEASRYLKPHGVVAVNIADGPGLLYVREKAATLASIFSEVIAVMDATLLGGKHFGNVVLVASNTKMQFADSANWLGHEETPSHVIQGAEVHNWIGKASVVTDASTRPSPPADRKYFASEAARNAV